MSPSPNERYFNLIRTPRKVIIAGKKYVDPQKKTEVIKVSMDEFTEEFLL